MKLSRATACATMMLVAALGVLVSIAPALANWTGLDASGKVITFFNTNQCNSVVCVPIAQPVDTSGNAFGVSANPFFISPASGATFPVSAISFPLPTGASTSALQTTGNTSLATIATNSGTQATAANQTTGNTSAAATASALGTTTDAPCTLPASTTACTDTAVQKAIANAVNSPIPNGTNTIGNVGSDPSSGKGMPASVPINISTATTTQLVALSGTTAIYVTSFDVIAGGTGNITFEYGTGTNCGTGTTALTGAYNLTAQAGIAKGDGRGMVLKVPAGNALCALTSAAVQMSGSLSYQQF